MKPGFRPISGSATLSPDRTQLAVGNADFISLFQFGD
jgi:hypothetical protein